MRCQRRLYTPSKRQSNPIPFDQQGLVALFVLRPATVNWFLDSNNDDVGDECQCGDFDGNGAGNALDIGGVAQVANGAIATTSFTCTRNTDPTAGGGG